MHPLAAYGDRVAHDPWVGLPPCLARLAATDPRITVTTTAGTMPTLIRALRAGSIDLAVLTSRPPHRLLDSESPRLHVETVADVELVVARLRPESSPAAPRCTSTN
ncbi:LysR substrate-binding domain-containing protein [Streptacidiphilus pinicola]|uniref:LysR substrate-binding domain-containing protein n=1 Tax=Streptacidiphilus pinicola TaxID=2219663 RepID=UPI00311FBCC7